MPIIISSCFAENNYGGNNYYFIRKIPNLYNIVAYLFWISFNSNATISTVRSIENVIAGII